MHALISGAYGNRTGCNSYWHSRKFNHNKFKTIVDYLHENNYYTCADVPTNLIMPKQNYDEYYVSDESSIDLKTHHYELLCKMKKLVDSKQKIFLHLHYSGIHEGIRDTVLKFFTNCFTRLVLKGPGAILIVVAPLLDCSIEYDFNKLLIADLKDEDKIKEFPGSLIIDDEI